MTNTPEVSPDSPRRRVLIVDGGTSTTMTAALLALASRAKSEELGADIVLVDDAEALMNEVALSNPVYTLSAANLQVCDVHLEGDGRPAWQKMNDEPWRQRRSRKMGR